MISWIESAGKRFLIFYTEDVDGVYEMYLAAAEVGGIHTNSTYPADLIREKLMIKCSIIHPDH